MSGISRTHAIPNLVIDTRFHFVNCYKCNRVTYYVAIPRFLLLFKQTLLKSLQQSSWLFSHENTKN